MKKALLSYCQSAMASSRRCNAPQPEIEDFVESWRNGVNLCALVDSLVPNHIRMDTLDPVSDQHHTTPHHTTPPLDYTPHRH